jgi:hypothetical protein
MDLEKQLIELTTLENLARSIGAFIEYVKPVICLAIWTIVGTLIFSLLPLIISAIAGLLR